MASNIEHAPDGPPAFHGGKRGVGDLRRMCDDNPGQWFRKPMRSSNIVTYYKDLGYDAVHRTIDGVRWLYLRKPV